MHSRFVTRRARRVALPALLALLFLARALVPVGYMLSIGAEGGLSLALCTSVALPTASSHGQHHHHGSGPGAGQQESRHDPCPFALAGGAALVRTLPALPEVAARYEPRIPVDDVTVVLRRFSGALGARAPPSVS